VGRTPRVPDELKSRPFSLDEARAAGLSHSALRGKSWQRVGSRLYRYNGAADDTLAFIHGLSRVLPADAVFVGRTAAWIHELGVQPANPVQVCVSGRQSRTGVEVRHCDVTGETVEIRGVRATSIERTLLDLCAWSPAVEALVAFDMAIRKGIVSNEDLRQYAKIRAGATRMRLLASIAAPAESPMETRLRWLLLEARLPLPEVQADLYSDGGEFIARADLYYPSAHLVIEFDGGNHRDRLVSDDRRQNALVTAGYRVLRFTGSDLRTRPDAVVAQVRGALGPQEYSPRRTAWY
jgi:very-short-patch-repair endonuclease